ncbi:photosystem II protein PsbQ [Nostoc sp. FACHB-152]|uniref:photosystem II protein PsbQ n=1 Tax=unclassified Nostoc TaxID=2593658 RepID=UPI001686463E|nr:MULTISPECIES: photosystem II protein PsbQ [unclassified Nostoc]MBD2446572.1 photosystem II protein PsbQ [Nostoc sp. FACHB-152]MBD2466420.1 photosystem II protein PsbQ [Nostoc sp. FACHB-145]
MARQRSIFSLILVLLATFLISCGGPGVAVAPPTYTTEQIAQIQEYVPEIQTVRDRADELKNLIQKNEWIKVGNFIHGPMAEARLAMTYIAPHLLPKDQTAARQITKDLLNHLVKVDQAASNGNSLLALSNYQAAFTDVDKFLQLLPEGNKEAES